MISPPRSRWKCQKPAPPRNVSEQGLRSPVSDSEREDRHCAAPHGSEIKVYVIPPNLRKGVPRPEEKSQAKFITPSEARRSSGNSLSRESPLCGNCSAIMVIRDLRSTGWLVPTEAAVVT